MFQECFICFKILLYVESKTMIFLVFKLEKKQNQDTFSRELMEKTFTNTACNVKEAEPLLFHVFWGSILVLLKGQDGLWAIGFIWFYEMYGLDLCNGWCHLYLLKRPMKCSALWVVPTGLVLNAFSTSWASILWGTVALYRILIYAQARFETELPFFCFCFSVLDF